MSYFYKNPDPPLIAEKRAELIEKLFHGRIEFKDLALELPYAIKRRFNLALAKFVLDDMEAMGQPLGQLFYEAYDQAVMWFPEDPMGDVEKVDLRYLYFREMEERTPVWTYDDDRQMQHYARMAVSHGTMLGVALGFAGVPHCVQEYLMARARVAGAAGWEVEEIGEQEHRRQVNLMIDILEDRPIRSATQFWRKETEEMLFENPSFSLVDLADMLRIGEITINQAVLPKDYRSSVEPPKIPEKVLRKFTTILAQRAGMDPREDLKADVAAFLIAREVATMATYRLPHQTEPHEPLSREEWIAGQRERENQGRLLADLINEACSSASFWRKETEEMLFENPVSDLTVSDRARLLEYLHRFGIRSEPIKSELPYYEKKKFNLAMAQYVLEQQELRGTPLEPVFYEAYELAVSWLPLSYEEIIGNTERRNLFYDYMNRMESFAVTCGDWNNFEDRVQMTARNAVILGTMYSVSRGFHLLPGVLEEYVILDARTRGGDWFEDQRVQKSERQRQVDVLDDILRSGVPIRVATQFWREEVEEGLFENPTLHFHTKKMKPKQKEALWRAQDELHAAGISFDTGYAFDSGVRDWEWDWSLRGPVSVTIHEREWLDAKSPKVSLREMPEDWPERRKRKKRKKRAANPFPDPTYPRTFEQLSEEGYSPVTPPEHYMRHFYGRSTNPEYSNPDRDPGDFMSLRDVLAFEPLAKRRGVSEVARSAKGFMGQYKRAKGRPKALENMWYSNTQSWMRRRNNFVKRHMAQIEKRGESLWEKNGNPTRRHLALIMWAYTPDPSGIKAWLRKNR